MKRYEAIVEKIAAAGEKKSVLMLTGFYKSLAGYSAMAGRNHREVDTTLGSVLRELQSPIEPDTKGSVLQKLGYFEGVLERSIKDLQDMRDVVVQASKAITGSKGLR
jgi:uncharacterized protein YaaN involved in tellurite resistance